jgi:hypothetical protein
LIVSGDQDLRVLQVFEGIPILTAMQAMHASYAYFSSPVIS